MDKLTEMLRYAKHWTINVQLLILYVVSTVLFFALHLANAKVTAPYAAKIQAGQILPCLLLFILTAAANFLGVTTLVILSKNLNTTPPLALLGLPLFLILESHTRKIYASAQGRRVHALSAAGVAIGICAATWLLMRHNPLT
ncbi:MAG: hypothetical protein WC881_12170 [Elusimicrobiota bacterium]|jgi:hypothetical protein